MALQNIRSGFAFTRNPIILRDSFPAEANDPRGGLLTVTMDGTDIFEGRFYPPLDIDLSEILDAYVYPLPEPHENTTNFPQPIIEIEDAGEFSCRSALVYYEYDSFPGEVQFTVIPGGISKQNFKRFVNTGQDIFNARFLNYKGNFFLTTRTAGWRISIKETELYPLYFLCPKGLGDLDITDVTSGAVYSCGGLDAGVMALDIDQLRRAFMEDYDVIPSIFDIYADGVFSCRIVVEQSDISKERYRLKFRNSLGVFEIIEITGEMTISPEYKDGEETTFKRYDSDTGDYYTDRERIERRQSIQVNTGVKREVEVRFLMDMIGSEEVYLLDLTPLPVKVIPSVEEMAYRPRPNAPQSFTLKLEISEAETNIMQDIIDGSEGRKPRVFSKQFSKQFN